MYSNDYTQIKGGLTNYIGSLLKACPYDGEKASRQFVAATLIEEALNLMKNNDNTYEMYVTKPLLRANHIILQNRKIELEKLPKTTNVKEMINSYQEHLDFLTNIINNIN